MSRHTVIKSQKVTDYLNGPKLSCLTTLLVITVATLVKFERNTYHYKSISEQPPVATCCAWRQGWIPLFYEVWRFSKSFHSILQFRPERKCQNHAMSLSIPRFLDGNEPGVLNLVLLRTTLSFSYLSFNLKVA